MYEFPKSIFALNLTLMIENLNNVWQFFNKNLNYQSTFKLAYNSWERFFFELRIKQIEGFQSSNKTFNFKPNFYQGSYTSVSVKTIQITSL